MTTIEKLKASHQKHPLKGFFLESGVTQAELSQFLGIPYQTVVAYLNGYRQTPGHINQQLESLARDIQTEIVTNTSTER